MYRFHSDLVSSKFLSYTKDELDELVVEMETWLKDLDIPFVVERDRESDWPDDWYIVFDNEKDAMHFKLRWL